MKRSVLFVVFCALVIGGCANISDALKAKDEGTVTTYPVGFDQAWNIARTVLRWEDAETIEEHKEENYMVTTVGQNFVSAGSIVAVWADPVDKSHTKVTIVTKRKVQTNIATGLTETTFHQRFEQAVGIVKSGKPLPSSPPAAK
jgi:hypothetical protein